MSDFKINSIATKQGQHGPVIAGVSTVNSTGCMKIPSGPTEFRGGRGRAIFCGGYTPSIVNTIDTVEIATTGDATDFGNLSATKSSVGAVASSTRAVIGGGAAPGAINVMEFVTIATTGNVTDFGDLLTARRDIGGASDSNGGLGD